MHKFLNLNMFSTFVSRYVLFAVALALAVASDDTANAHAMEAAETETFSPLEDEQAPQNFEALWSGYDPTAEPLETEVLHTWEEEGVVLKVVRFRVGLFKGGRAMLAGVYGFPKGQAELPGLVQVHGGGQYADHRAVLANAKRGYATLSIAWAGRISAPNYKVNPGVVRLFWDRDTDHPDYRVTTDWGKLDGYHAPRRDPDSRSFPSITPTTSALDNIESPRNSGWFLACLAARRALTFLEAQPEVDSGRLGMYGHSMGGKITVLAAAADDRIKAAAPSCGGISDRDSTSPLFRATLGDDAALKHITCPIIFLSPANDFHGRIDDLPTAITEIKSKEWRVTSSPHHNHQDTAEYEVATLLWFDQHLKQSFAFPSTPKTQLKLNNPDGVPTFTVRPDPSRAIQAVEIVYTQHGQPGDEPNDRNNTKSRFWHHAVAEQRDGVWHAKLPLDSVNSPLWVYANVLYALDEPISGAGYYYGSYNADAFNVSSTLRMADPNQLAAAGVRATPERSLTIENFKGDWKKDWFSYKKQQWAIQTHKIYARRWAAPDQARLNIDVQSISQNQLVVGIDDYAAALALNGGDDWQSFSLSPNDFTNANGEALTGWAGIRTLRLGPSETLRIGQGASRNTLRLGGAWQGQPPRFRSLRWSVPADNDKHEPNARVGGDEAKLLDVFPASTFFADRPGDYEFTEAFAPSVGPWMKGLDERNVFNAALTHKQDEFNSYELRIGKGGQIYSLSGAFGQSVPPSWRSQGATSPWNDEVWQFVSVCQRYNKAKDPPSWMRAGKPYSTSYFIHNSGCYMPEPINGVNTLYCPTLAEQSNAKARVYRQLNWGLVPQTRTIHRSPLLYYVQVRDAGEGVIELTYVVHNFSVRDDVVFDYHNAPWGGTRVSSLPLTFVSTPDGELERDDPQNNPFQRGTDVRNTGGFTLSSVHAGDNSPALALVYGLDKHREAQAKREQQGEDHVQLKPSLYRSWRASAPNYQTRWKDFKNIPANSFRNYQVVEVIPKLALRPQSTIWYRSYLVVAGKARCAQLAKQLVEHVDYGSLSFAPESAAQLVAPSLADDAAFKLFAQPVPGTLPLFVVRHKPTGKIVYTTDPYIFTPQEKLDLAVPQNDRDYDYFKDAVGYTLDGETEYLGLAGFAYREPPKSSGWQKISTVAPHHRSAYATEYDVDVWVKPNH